MKKIGVSSPYLRILPEKYVGYHVCIIAYLTDQVHVFTALSVHSSLATFSYPLAYISLDQISVTFADQEFALILISHVQYHILKVQSYSRTYVFAEAFKG